MDRAPDGLHLAQVVITLTTDEHGTEYIEVDADEDTSTVTMLGMLDLARAHIIERLSPT